jgi:hypothetical protein
LSDPHAWTPAERRLLQSLRTPGAIQRWLDEEIRYDGNEHCYSPRRLLRERKGHCMEGSLFAAATLRYHGHPPLLVDLGAVRDDDHVLAVFRRGRYWGAVGKSNYPSLRFREPVYRSLRELVMSYFEHYHNLKGEKTLRRYSQPMNLTRFDHLHWMTSDEEVWDIPAAMGSLRFYSVLPAGLRLNRVDSRLRQSERVGAQSY